MKKLILLIVMMLAIAGVVAQGVDFTVNKDLKKAYYLAKINITSGTAPFDIVLNGRHLDQYHLYCQYDVNNIITITDANSTSKTDTIYESDPNFHWSISLYEDECEFPIDPNNPGGILIDHKIGFNIGCTFDERYNFDIRCYDIQHREIDFGIDYWGGNDSVNVYLNYQNSEIPVGLYLFIVKDTIRTMDTMVFLEIIDPNDTISNDTNDTTIVDTTTTDTTQHLTIAIIQDVDDVVFHPNPTSDFCNSSEVLREIYILDYMGRRLRKITHTNKIDLAGLPAGIYILEYVRQNGTKDKVKIVKRI